MVIATVVNMLGVKVMARLNNIGVMAELIGCSILVILMIFHFQRGPGVVTHSLGTGAGHSWGYFGAFLIGGIMSAYVMYGFDTAGTLAEETHDPRRAAPPAILRALAAAAILGGLLILFALMDVKNISDKNISLAGLPYIVKQALGNTVGNVFLADAGLAILVCTLAVCTACIRMLFSMARDGRLPGGSSLARVSGRARVPIVPALFVGFCALVILLVNLANQSAFVTLTSVAIVMFYLPYLAVTGSMLYRRMHGELAAPRPRPVLQPGPVGFRGQPVRGGVRRGGRVQHRLAAQGRVRDQVVLPVRRLRVHRRVVRGRAACTTSWCSATRPTRCWPSTAPRCRPSPASTSRWARRLRDRQPDTGN